MSQSCSATSTSSFATSPTSVPRRRSCPSRQLFSRRRKSATGRSTSAQNEQILNPSHRCYSKEHLFDGKTAHGKIANFQLCDISDPLLQSLIQAREGVQPACLPDLEGWWDRDYFEQMRNVVRRKFLGCHNNVLISDTDCEDLLGDPKIVWVTGSKGAKRGKTVDSDASRDGSASETEVDEPGGGSGSEAGEDRVATKKRRKAAIARGKAKASWEPNGKKKKAQAKKPAKGETAEEKVNHVLRLRALSQADSASRRFRRIDFARCLDCRPRAVWMGRWTSESSIVLHMLVPLRIVSPDLWELAPPCAIANAGGGNRDARLPDSPPQDAWIRWCHLRIPPPILMLSTSPRRVPCACGLSKPVSKRLKTVGLEPHACE